MSVTEDKREGTSDESPLDVLKTTVQKIEKAADEQEDRSINLRRFNGIVSFSAAILGVGAPTLVAYFAQTRDVSSYLKLFAVLCAALAGATTVLLNTFRWGQRYGQASLAAISLRELASSTRLRLYDFTQAAKTGSYKTEELQVVNRDSQKQMFDILRGVVQNEAAIFSKEPEAVASDDRLKLKKRVAHKKSSGHARVQLKETLG